MILSIDIGIKNLSICLIASDGSIRDWDILDLTNTTIHSCNYCMKHKRCTSRAIYTIAGKMYYCNRHITKCIPSIRIAPPEYYSLLKKPSLMKTKKLNHMFELNASVEELTNHIYQHCATKVIQPVSANDMDLINIGKTLSTMLTNRLTCINDIDTVLIENQISTIASRMKCVQGMVAQFFIEKAIYNILFISSINKLKLYDVPKKTYKERKSSGILVVLDLLENSINHTWLSVFHTHKKKDDLADSYLQALWFIHTKT
jgi:hypothetical protein